MHFPDRWNMTTICLTQILWPWTSCGVLMLSISSQHSGGAKSLNFCSHLLNPCTEGINTLTLSWTGGNNWLFPPLYLTTRSMGCSLSPCGHLLHGGRSSPGMEGTLTHLCSTGWTFLRKLISLSHQNQAPVFLVEG